MSDGTKAFLQRWFVTTLGVLAATSVVDGVSASGWRSLIAASLLLGILNAILRPFLLIAALPLVILTLGLFTFVINALLLYFVANLVKGFSVAGFWAAFKGALIISIISVIANMMLGTKRVEVRRGQAGRPRDPDRPGGGPVIDV
jgi:putative membrane protein